MKFQELMDLAQMNLSQGLPPFSLSVWDKTGLTDGPWMSEPDIVFWLQAQSRLPCLILRNEEFMHLNAYVGIPPASPLYEMSASDIANKVDIKINYADKFVGPAQHAHDIHAEIAKSNFWWVGVDFMDLVHDESPTVTSMFDGSYPPPAMFDPKRTNATYKDIEFAKNYCETLANLISTIKNR